MRGNVLYDVGTILYATGCGFGVLFTLIYGLTAPWWRSAVGRMFMSIGAAIVFAGATVLYQIAVQAIAGAPLPTRTTSDLILRLIGYGIFTQAMGFLLFTYLHERRQPASVIPMRKDRLMTDLSKATVDDGAIKRAWLALAPKLVAFLATGLTTSGLLGVLQLFGIQISPELATMLVGGLSTIAAVIIRDNLLALQPGQFSLKVLTFLITSASATGVVALLGQFGIDLTPHAPLVGLVLTLLGSILGYVKADSKAAASPALVKAVARRRN